MKEILTVCQKGHQRVRGKPCKTCNRDRVRAYFKLNPEKLKIKNHLKYLRRKARGLTGTKSWITLVKHRKER